MLYKPISTCLKNENYLEVIEKNMRNLERIDQETKAKNQLKGRYIKEGIADGYAIYQIIRENKKTVRIRVCTGLGDDWIIPYWGEETTIEKKYAVENIRRRDAFSELFKSKTK